MLIEVRINEDEDEGVGVGDIIAIIHGGADEPVPHPPLAAAPAAQAVPIPASRAIVDDSLRGTTQKLTRLRKTFANRMVESLQISAQLTTIVEVDVTGVGQVRRQHNTSAAGEAVKLSGPTVCRSSCRWLRETDWTTTSAARSPTTSQTT